MEEPSLQNQLLQEARQAIESLRRENDLQAARLTMFDDINRIMHARLSESGVA